MQRESSVSSHFIFQALPPLSPQLDHWKPQSPRKTPANPDTRLSVKPSLNHLRAPSSRGPKSLAGRPENKLPLWLVLVCPAPLAKTWAPPMNSCLEQRILPHLLRPPYRNYLPHLESPSIFLPQFCPAPGNPSFSLWEPKLTFDLILH